MIIDKLNIGAHGKTVKYAVCADALHERRADQRGRRTES